MANYKSTTDQGDCLFCKIISGDIKTPGIFWENDIYLAFLSTWPNTLGFTVVVPKAHFGSDVLKMPDEKVTEFLLAAKHVQKILLQHFKDVGRVGLIMEGTGIDHAHIKLFPMHGTEHFKKGEWKQYHSENDTFFQTYQGFISSNDGPKANEDTLAELAKQLKDVRLNY